ncbi:hypothetical protein WMY93_034407, partial [Mugilogobius chulae]
MKQDGKRKRREKRRVESGRVEKEEREKGEKKGEERGAGEEERRQERRGNEGKEEEEEEDRKRRGEEEKEEKKRRGEEWERRRRGRGEEEKLERRRRGEEGAVPASCRASRTFCDPQRHVDRPQSLTLAHNAGSLSGTVDFGRWDGAAEGTVGLGVPVVCLSGPGFGSEVRSQEDFVGRSRGAGTLTDTTRTGRRSGGPNEAGCGTSSFCWKEYTGTDM